MSTPYDVLGVPRDATHETIRMAFRNAAKACHPDLNSGDPTTEQQFRQLIAAYELLKTPQQRALYDQYLARNERYFLSFPRQRGRPLTVPTVAGVVSAGVVAAVVWLSISQSNRPEPSGPPLAPHITAGPVSQPADRQAATIEDGGIGHNGDGGRASDRAVAAPASRPPDDPPHQLQQSASHRPSTADHTEPQAPLAKGWEQVQASGDPRAIWEFTLRNPDAPESELARSKLVALIESAEDLSLLHMLRNGATDAIAERAQQRLARLGALAPSQEDRTLVARNSDRANDTAASNDPALYLARGELRARAGDFDQAIADFDEAIRLEPGRALAYSHRGDAWSRKGDKDRALADYEAAIRIDPKSPDLFRDRGILWRSYGDLDRALVDFDRAIRMGFSDAHAYNERGLVWYEKKSLDRAIADFNQALKINPNLVEALINRGNALRSKGDPDRAIADFHEAIRIDPNVAAAQHNRALAPSATGGFGPATKDDAKERGLPSIGSGRVAAPHLP